RTFTFPAYSLPNSSMIGATIWQGPHQTAQKSTITSSEAFITSTSHVASSTLSASPATSHSPFAEYTITIQPRGHRIPALFEESNPPDLRITVLIRASSAARYTAIH